MSIKKIKLKQIDDTSPYNYPVKSMEIRTSRGNILTPSRIITNHEYNQKMIVPTDITLDDNVSLFMNKFNYDELSSFLVEDKPFDNLSNRLRIYNERAQHSLLNLALFKLTDGPGTSKKRAIDIFENERQMKKFYRMIIQLQKLMKFDPITVYVPNISVSIAKTFMHDIYRTIEKENLSSIFFFDLGKNFPKLLNYAITDLNQQLIGINYKKYTNAVQSYEEMRNFYDKDIAFIVANTTRSDGSFDGISAMHYMPFLSNDLFGSFVPSGFGGGKNYDPKKRLDSVKLFDKNQLTLNKISESNFDVDQILKESGKPNEETLRDMLVNFEKIADPANDQMLNRFKAFTKIHEAKTSANEFSIFQKRIKERSTREYVDEEDKKALKSAVSVFK